jgi:hypothetical protein
MKFLDLRSTRECVGKALIPFEQFEDAHELEVWKAVPGPLWILSPCHRIRSGMQIFPANDFQKPRTDLALS